MGMTNQQAAHVWNAQNGRDARSSNGNMFSAGRALYSYGRHFLIGYIMPDGVALMNADSYSVSTSRQQSDAHRAISNRRRAFVSDLTDMAGDYKTITRLADWIERGSTASERAAIRANVRKLLTEFATQLATPIREPGASRWTEGAEGEELGAYLARLAGLPATSWPKAKRERAAADKRAAEAEARRKVTSEERLAIACADVLADQWRRIVSDSLAGYSDARLRQLRTELIRARGLMLKATSGKLAAKSRLAIVRERIKELSGKLAEFDKINAIARRNSERKRWLSIVRNWRDLSADGRRDTSWPTMRDVAEAAERLAERGRLASLKASCDELAKLAHMGMDLIAAENMRQRELERARQAAEEAEKRERWLAGENVRAYFDAPTGGAALRIVGDTLQTSHGAEVPLAHAIKAFRFIKLCRERGESFQRNGRTIRVGHFQVDRIAANGDFVAGCHSFTWPEVERVARLAGVADLAPSAEAIETK